MKKIFFLLLISLLAVSCARVGSPVGGNKDSLAPKFLGANIDTLRVNVPISLKELRLDFDEYISLKEISKNLLITPDIKKIKKIIPSNLANKSIIIQWEDSLQAHTTYSFNFGNAISDYNEGNVLPYFNFAFSTGNKLDELFVSGTVEDGMLLKKKSETPKENKMVVGLFEASEKTDFKKKPQYITKVDEENYFEIPYLKKGQYHILAFEDDNQNSVYDPGKEKVGFLKDKISLDSSSIRGLKLKLYPSKKALKYLEYKAQNGGLLLTFEGHPEKVEVNSLSEELNNYKVTHRPRSDSASVWFTPENNGFERNQSRQLKLSYRADEKSDTLSVSYRATKQEFLLANKAGSLLAPEQAFRISSVLPLESLNSEKWKLESDSTTQDFTAKISSQNPFELMVVSSFKPGKKYALTLPKESVSSYYAQNDKAYRFEFEVDKPENYGAFKVKLLKRPKAKYWLELLDARGDIKYSQYTDSEEVLFQHLKPGDYSARIRVDQNGNHYWDEADFAQNMMAEEVHIFEKEISIRPMWTIEEIWEINKP